MLIDLNGLDLSDMSRLGAALRQLGSQARTFEEVAGRVVRLLHESLVDGDPSTKACSLVRLYRTVRFDQLPPDLRAFGQDRMKDIPLLPEARCLTLMGTAGLEPAWNDRRTSARHNTIPLPSADILATFPMVSQLMLQLGIETNAVIQSPDAELLLELEQRTYGVFYVPEAAGSPYIPAQDQFVRPYGIRSVLGGGGLLPTGDIFAIFLFAKVPISRNVAEMFRNATMNVKAALLGGATRPLFDQ